MDEEIEIEKVVEVLQKDLKMIEKLKEENKKIRETNNQLREKLVELAKELKNLKNGDEKNYKYSFNEGWKKKFKLDSEAMHGVQPEDIDRQINKTLRLIEEAKK